MKTIHVVYRVGELVGKLMVGGLVKDTRMWIPFLTPSQFDMSQGIKRGKKMINEGFLFGGLFCQNGFQSWEDKLHS